MSQWSSYLRVLVTFARNSLVRDMTFRGNFLIELVASTGWVLMSLAFYVLIFEYTPMLGAGTGWGKNEFFVFFATALLINSVIEAFFMTNADELSDLIRKGDLDFVLLKPMDTQFLVSVRRFDWSSLGNFALGAALLAYGLLRLDYVPGPAQIVLYPFYVVCGVVIYYNLMFAMAATSIWMGRNLTLLDFWFYITILARYPMEIYHGRLGTPLRQVFTFAIPVLVVVNVPARLLLRPLMPESPEDWLLPAYTVVAMAVCVVVTRWVFQRALTSYRSASS